MRHLTSYRYIDAIAKAGSIRKAAETLAITPSALNRRVLVFERLPRGVQLSAAGELLIHHIRHLLDAAVMRSSLRLLKLEPVAESDSFEFLRHHAMTGEAITFQIPIGLASPDEPGPLVARPLDANDVPDGLLYMGQLRGRTLPVAAARFADQLVQARYA